MRCCRGVLFVGAFVIALTSALGTGIPSAQARDEQRQYVGGTGDVTPLCTGKGVDVGGSCFTVASTDRFVSITIRDMVGQITAGQAWFIKSNGGTVSHQAVCGPTKLSIPLTTATLQIYVDEALAVFDCPQFLPGTAGTIFVSFSAT